MSWRSSLLKRRYILVTVSVDENATGLFPPPPPSPVEDGSFLVNANSASLLDGYDNGSDIYVVDGYDNVDFGDSGATAKTNIAIPLPPPPLTEHDWDDNGENHEVDIYKIDGFESDYFDLGCNDDDDDNDEHYIGRDEATVNAIPPPLSPFDGDNHGEEMSVAAWEATIMQPLPS